VDNHIDFTRNIIKINFKGSQPVEYPPKMKYFSPDEKYFFQMEVFSKPIDDGITFGNYFFSKIDIFNTHSQEKIFGILNNHSENHHQWLTNDGKTYLFFAEFEKGITVYNLTDKTQNTYLKEDSHHQIIQYFPSPDALKMATVEYGLQEFQILIYDISKPMELPFPVVFRKKIEDSNGKHIKAINWGGSGNIEIIHHEQIQICNTSLKVQVVGISEDKYCGKCQFEDIDGKVYFCYEKLESLFGFFVDENTIFPIESGVSVNIIEIFTQKEQKIATVSVEIDYLFFNVININVFENQLHTYWYHKDYIK
jgi:hypothetical protein